MSVVDHITRAQMTHAMSDQFNADVSETFVHNCAQVDTIVANQRDFAVNDATIDLHMIELCLGGNQQVSSQTEAEGGDRIASQFLAGNVAYYKPNVAPAQEVLGTAKLQQFYIDDLVFRSTAQSVLSGDPDHAQTLAFFGVFEPQIKALCKKLLEEARYPSIGSDLISQEIALQILRRRDPARFKLPKTHKLSDAQLARIIAYFEDEIEDIGGMEHLANLIGMDVYSFTRSFKATTGETPAQFLIQRRLTRAKDLLRLSDDALADIAYAVGFANQPHMTSTFTKYLGVPPGKWRASLRG